MEAIVVIYHERGNRYGFVGHDLSDLAETVRDTTAALRPHLHEFDSIIVTGVSGLVVGAPVALRLRKPLVVLRKPGDDSHHASCRAGDGPVLVNRVQLGKRVLFLDDFVAGGDTFGRILAAVRTHDARLVASFMYRDERYWEGETW